MRCCRRRYSAPETVFATARCRGWRKHHARLLTARLLTAKLHARPPASLRGRRFGSAAILAKSGKAFEASVRRTEKESEGQRQARRPLLSEPGGQHARRSQVECEEGREEVCEED